MSYHESTGWLASKVVSRFLKTSAFTNIFVLQRCIKWRCQNIAVRQIGINWEAMKGDGKALMVNGEVLKRNEYALCSM